MCLAIASPSGKLIPEDYIRDAALHNSHGGGIAWYDEENKKVQWRKGGDEDDVINWMTKERPTDAPFVIHHRISTCGGTPQELTHPFPIDALVETALSGATEKVLFHNGVFPNWKDNLRDAIFGSKIHMPPGGHWSDTRAMAFIVSIGGPEILGLLDTNSRYCVMDATKDSKGRMRMWGDWIRHEEFMFSNRGNVAFHTRSSFQSPANARTADVGEKDEKNERETSADSDGAASQSSTTQRPTSTSTTSSVQSATSKTSRRYKPRGKHNPWEKLTPRGTETARGAREIAPSEIQLAITE